MALPIIGSALGFIGSFFFRKVTESAPSGQPVTRRRATPMSKTLVYVLSAACVYHFLVYPIISYHWPHYNFPPIDAALLNIVLGMGGGQ